MENKILNSNKTFPINYDLEGLSYCINNLIKIIDKSDKTFDMINHINQNFFDPTKNILLPNYLIEEYINKLIFIFDEENILILSQTENFIDYLTLLFNLYIEENIDITLNTINNSNIEPDLIQLYNSFSKNIFNKKLDNLIINCLFSNKHISEKEILIYIPNLMHILNQSTSNNIRILIITLITYYKIESKNIEKSYLLYPIILTITSEVLLIEGSLFSNYLNNKIYNNKFSNFDYNYDEKKKIRKVLKENEFKFLQLNFFKLLEIVLNTIYIISYKDYKKNIFDFKTFYEIFDLYFDCKNSQRYLMTNEILIYKLYLFFILITEIIEFIYSSVHYLDESFKYNNQLTININEDIFTMKSISEEIRPIGYSKFLVFIFKLIFEIFGNNFIYIINHFYFVSDLKSKYKENFEYLANKNDNDYYINNIPNPIGLSMIVILYYKSSYFPQIINNFYKLNIILPILSLLLKRSQNFKYLSIELLIILFNNFRNLSLNIDDVKSYSIIDIIHDLIAFIGGEEPEIKRIEFGRIFISNILYKFDKKSLEIIFNEFILEELNPNKLTNKEGIKDKQISYILNCMKVLFQNEILNSNDLFDIKFLHNIVSKTVTIGIFFLDIIEVLSTGLNFLSYLIIIDKKKYNGSLQFYNYKYLDSKRKEINEISNVVNKWVNKTDEEKIKFIEDTYINNNFSRTKTKSNVFAEEDRNSLIEFNNTIKKNQAIICLGLLNHIEKLFDKSLKELNNKY